MATEVKLPELGDGIESGDVLEIFVSVGDVISEGQDIVEMETDKATVPVPASVGGKVTKITVSEGETVPIGGVILEVEAAAGAAPAAPQSAPEPAQSAPEPPQSAPEPAQPAPEPVAQRPAPVQPVESAPPAPPAPPVTPQPAATIPQPAPPSAPVTSNASADVIPAGPAIRRFAREVGVDLSLVSGSGEGGRITREDVLAVVRSSSQAHQARASTTPSASSGAPAVSSDPKGASDVDDFGAIHVERMSKIRKTISRQMHASWSAVPRVTNFDDADITDLEQLRQASKEEYAANGLKLTTMPFLIKAVAMALRHHPTINAVIDEENEQVIYKDYVNVGIAVDTERGLVVPVMPNADQQGIPEITRSLAEMAGKVRSGNFAVSDLKGGTFTISNLGAIGGQYSTPIVNVPEVAILLVGRSRKLPVVMPDDSIAPRLMMPLSLSYDHRLVDGGTAARFLNEVIEYLEAPTRLLLAL
ncbi:MAG: 2-oxo acid dehydrogenase subunit E2 [Pirellulales bacterium]|nr:2-oxo acid dehydrogenase subunit E2 [Pirellulales bacterium]